ncbi:hypothetical protein J6590_085593 [Homalodisca vitripennis]|nr:hypothetical protein J6590_085593 [Homalodisca vitripennis]
MTPKAKPLSVSNLIPFDSAGMTSKLLSLRVPVTGALKPGARLLQITSSQPQPTHRGGSRQVERSTTAAEKAEVAPDTRNAGRRPTAATTVAAAATVTTTLYSAVTIPN